LLGETRDVAAAFGKDGTLGRFSVNSETPVSELQVEQYMEAAKSVAVLAVQSLPTLLPCDPTVGGEDACAREFLSRFSRRAFRRPLLTEELENITAVYQATRVSTDFGHGIQVALERVLQSPHFLYHLELGTEPGGSGVVPLTPHEQAARLSFFLWQSAPDDELMAAADAGALATAEAVATQALRMLKDERAVRTLRTFHAEWLGLSELEAHHDASLAHSMREETLRTLDEIVWRGTGQLHDYFSATGAYLDGPLRELYGISDPAADPSLFTQYELDPATRAGILTRAGFLAGNSPPSGRGKFIRTELLCGAIPPPPAGVSTDLPESQPDEPPRKRWERHVSDPQCGGCHRLMDLLGFGFENYDEHGRYRSMYGDFPVDASGEIVATTDIDGAFAGAQQLQAKLATSADVRACMTHQWFRFALGRDPRQDLDKCSLKQVNATFAASGYKIQDLMLAVTQSDSFRHRRTEGAAQ
jgi:hypothetical protein